MLIGSLAFLLGFFSLACQTLVFREHLLVYSGNELGAGVFFGSWMLWIAVGAVAGRFGPLRRPAVHALLLLLFPLAFFAQLYFVWSLRGLAGVASTELFPLRNLVLMTFVAGAPVSFCTGLLFTATARRLTHEAGLGPGLGAAKVYGLEALGSLVAGGAITAALLLAAPTPYLLPSVCLLWEAGAACYAHRQRVRLATVVHLVAVALLAIGLVAGLPSALERSRRQALPVPGGLEIVESVDTPYRNVTVARTGTSTALFANGELVTAMPDDITAANRAAVLYAMRPQASRILVLGLGAESLVCELARGPAAEVVFVGVDRGFSEISGRYFPPELTRCLAGPKVTFVLQDPRRFLATAEDAAPFDLAVLAAGEPRTASAARFYSVEFFRQVRSRLAPDGAFSLEITVTENVLLSSALLYARAVYTTLAVVFAEVEITAGETMGVFASSARGAVSSDPEELARRFGSVAHFYPQFPVAAFSTLFETARIEARRQALEVGGYGSVSRDTAPSVFLLSLLAAHSESHLLPLIEGARRHAGPVFLVLLLALILTSFSGLGMGRRDNAGFVPGFTIFAAGFAAMVGQLVVVLGYQAAFGSLFAEFGLLNGAFMLGLFTGSFVVGRRVRVTGAPLLPSVGLGLVLLAGWLFLWCEPQVSEALRWGYFGGSLGLGVCAGWTLISATLELGDSKVESGAAAAYLEGLDHLGAMAGGLIGGLVLIPLTGLGEALLLAGALVGTCLVLRGVALLKGRGEGAVTAPRVPASPLRSLLLFVVLAAGGCGVLVWDAGVNTDSGPGALRGQTASVSVAQLPSEVPAGPRQGDLTVSSFTYAPEVQGWAGPMELMVTLDPNERVVDVRLGRHSETPEYVYGIDRWFTRFRGKDSVGLTYGGPQEASGVDVLTGATVTGAASVEIVRRVGRELRGLTTGERPSEPAVQAVADWEKPGPVAFVPWLSALLFVLAGAGLYVWGRWRLRLVFLVVVVALSGVVWNFQLAFDTAATLLGGSVPPWSNVLLWVVLGGAGITLLLFGPLYCGSLCPFGAATELLSLGGLRWRPEAALDRRLRSVKYALALALLGAFAVWPVRSLFSFDPLAFAFRFDWDVAATVMLALVAAGSLLYYRFWCRYLCPLGAVLSLFEMVALAARLAPSRVSGRCHVGVVVGEDLDCLRCNRCVALAPASPRLPIGRGGDLLAVALVAAVLAAGAARVAAKWTPQSDLGAPRAVASSPEAGEGPATTAAQLWTDPGDAAAQQCVAPVPDEAAGACGPKLYRRDDKQYEFQRDVDMDKLRRLLESGRLSGREADHFVPLDSIRK